MLFAVTLFQQKPRPQQEAKAPDTLKPVGMVKIEAWFLPCQEPHREVVFPRGDEYYSDGMNFMDMICTLQEEQVTRNISTKLEDKGKERGYFRT